MNIQLSDHFTYRRLLRFSLPSIAMMVFTSVYGVVDGLFISNFVGKLSFAAVNFIMPALILLGSLGFMLGTGGSALVGKLLGEGREREANSMFSLLIYLTAASGLGVTLLGNLIIEPVAVFLGAGESMLADCVRYARICLCGMPALMLQYAFQSFFVTAEKPQLGLYVTVAAGVLNMALDALLVGLLRLGVAGAALATVASQTVGGVAPLLYFFRRNTSLLRLGAARFDGRGVLQALGNGASEFVSNISMSVVSMLYNGQLMKYAGEDGVAVYGVLMYVNFIFLAIFIGYSVGIAPVISFHYGAKNTEELHSLLGKSLRILAVFACLMLLAGELLARPLSSVFVSYDARLMDMTLRAFRFFSFSFLFAAVPIFGSSFFTALNDGFTSAAISFLRTVVFQIGAVLLLPLLLGIDGIWLSLVAAELVAAAVTVTFWVRRRKRYHY